MSINATLIGQTMLLWLVFSTTLIALLARKRSDTPALVTLVGAVLSLIPPLGMAYMGFLALKGDSRRLRRLG
ncbi:hypothetical protein SAMN04488540_1149 [Ferrimonas sediminum]|uniref:Phospholipase_D-nuclease N-terminal n=1 Tax=Ferrimonas sediminum TaxID=718193 RepID=A0A1G8WWS3_9GAMM|nr:hypothetical protein [Ferrimonas sediminum]SDJ82075.1 hypothetical protein SAMN04488540_1149 [Ferrimonas sediminum]